MKLAISKNQSNRIGASIKAKVPQRMKIAMLDRHQNASSSKMQSERLFKDLMQQSSEEAKVGFYDSSEKNKPEKFSLSNLEISGSQKKLLFQSSAEGSLSLKTPKAIDKNNVQFAKT